MGVDVLVNEKERERARGRGRKADVRRERAKDPGTWPGTIFLDLLPPRWSFHPLGGSRWIDHFITSGRLTLH